MMQTLYETGVRRVIVMGSGPLGCAPGELAQHSPNGECAPGPQAAAELFEPQLTQMVQDLNVEFGAHVFIAANTKLMHHDIFTDPQAYGKKHFLLNLFGISKKFHLRCIRSNVVFDYFK